MPTYEVAWKAEIKGRILVEAETPQEADRLVEVMDIATLSEDSIIDHEEFALDGLTATIDP